MARQCRPRLAVWKFASCDGCQLSCSIARTNCWRSPRQSRSPISPKRRRVMAKGPYDLSLVEGSITTRARREAHPEKCGAQSQFLVTIGACATAGGIQALRNFARHRRLRGRRLRAPGVYQHAGHLDADLRPCAGRFRAARLPDRQAPAAGGDLRVPGRPQAGDRQPQRLRRVQVARHCLRHGAQGTPCLGPVTHAGCGAICPSYQSRLLRLLRARKSGRTPPRLAPNGSTLGVDASAICTGSSAPSTPPPSRSARRARLMAS